MIATVHGLDHQRAKWGKLASTYIMLGEKCAVKFADEIIVLSEGVQNYFKHNLHIWLQLVCLRCFGYTVDDRRTGGSIDGIDHFPVLSIMFYRA